MKRLYRSRSEEMIAGVCAGLAEYLGVDPTAVRLAFVFLLFVGLGGFWLYVILWIIMPLEPGQAHDSLEVRAREGAASVDQLNETSASGENKNEA